MIVFFPRLVLLNVDEIKRKAEKELTERTERIKRMFPSIPDEDDGEEDNLKYGEGATCVGNLKHNNFVSLDTQQQL